MWLSTKDVIELHDLILAKYGGLPGIGREDLLISAVHAPKDLWYYEQETNLCALAARYGLRIAKNHAFADGNKRTALLAVNEFLSINGCTFDPPDTDETVEMIEQAAEDELTEEEFCRWITQCVS